jgi:hypothetical protein
VYELLVFLILSVFLECGIGIMYGVGIGYNPILVFPAAIAINFLTILAVVFIIDRLLCWKKGLRSWLEKRLSRGKKFIDKYGCYGLIGGILVLSPIQLSIMGRLLGIEPRKLYPSLLSAVVIVATAFMGIALGIFKVLL